MADVRATQVAKEAALFIVDVAKQFSLTEDTVRSLLKDKFGTFKSINTRQYRDYLAEEAKKIKTQEEWERKEREQMEKDRLAGIHFPKECPYHKGAVTYGDIRWGRKGWRCSIGGSSCHHHWRVDTWAKNAGQPPVDWSNHVKLAEAIEQIQEH